MPMAGHILMPVYSRGNAVATEDVRHRLVRQGMTQIGQRAYDSVIAPADILFGHSDDQVFELGLYAWPARVTA